MPTKWLRYTISIGTFCAALSLLGPFSAHATPRPQENPAVAAMVPASIRHAGVIIVGTDATYPPFESVDPTSRKIIGFDPDIAQGLAAIMGLKLKLVNVTFDTLIPSLAAGKFDIAMSSIGDTVARQKVVDFVTYYWNGSDILVTAGNPKHLGTNSLCGATVGVERGSLQQTTMLPQLDKGCSTAGKPSIHAVFFDSNSAAALALRSRRIQAVFDDAAPNSYAASHSGGLFQAAGPLLHNANPGGVAIPKTSGLQKPILAAMKILMKDGYYRQTIRKWNVTAIAISTPVLNGARS